MSNINIRKNNVRRNWLKYLIYKNKTPTVKKNTKVIFIKIIGEKYE